MNTSKTHLSQVVKLGATLTVECGDVLNLVLPDGTVARLRVDDDGALRVRRNDETAVFYPTAPVE